MRDTSSCARSNPARPLLGLLLRSLSIRRLGRRYPVSCALQVGDGVLPRLRPHAFFARSLRRPPDEDGGLELPPYLTELDEAAQPKHCAMPARS
jgi:hypothetical protein